MPKLRLLKVVKSRAVSWGSRRSKAFRLITLTEPPIAFAGRSGVGTFVTSIRLILLSRSASSPTERVGLPSGAIAALATSLPSTVTRVLLPGSPRIEMPIPTLAE